MTEHTETDADGGADPKSADAPADNAEITEPAAPDVDDLTAALEEAKALADENWGKYLRAAADLENLRKRSARELENAHKFGIERFAGELLAVLDSLEMGLEAGLEASAESLLEGKAATLKLLRTAMERHGVEEIDPAGEVFDPQLHEAMTVQPSETAEPGSVVTVVQKGYQLNGRLLRPARVVVASEAPAPAGEGDQEA